MKHLPAAAVLLLSLVALWFRPSPAAIVAQAQPSAPSGAREAWAIDLLARLGNAQPTPATVAFVVAWTVAEDACMQDCGYSSAWERNNWLNSTMPGYGAYATIDGDGVKAYPDYESGMAATIATLTNGLYDNIVAGLQTNDPERAYQALITSPWAGSRYGGGASFEQAWRQS